MSEIQFNGKEWEVSDALQAFYVPYGSYVIQTRALPDARDGLKTGARFILFSQYKDKLTYKDKRRKAVATVNAAMRFSPHGDSSILGTAVRLSQDFSMRYPIMEVQGNNGSYLSGDDYSQARYLEMRGNKIAYEMTHLLDKETIDNWKLNYTQEEEYPTVLPSKFPFSLVNGSFGIGVACSSSIPPHCLTDVCEAIKKVINNPAVSFEEIYCPIDFPTGGIIINESEVKESLKNGHGASAIVRAKIEYDEKNNELIVTEMPYMTFTTATVQSISKAIEEGSLLDVESVYDGTDYSGCKIYIKLTKNANPEKVKLDLYKHTMLQNSFSINMNMLEEGKIPKMFTWKESICAYVKHLKNIVTKSYQYDLRKLKERIHILEGLIIAYQNIDEVVELIRKSNNATAAKEELIKRYNLSENQSDAILKMKLSNLTHLEIDKLINEKQEKEIEAKKIEEILSNEENLKKEMLKEIDKLKEEYGDKRRTICLDINREEEKQNKEIENIKAEETVVIITRGNSIKRIPKTNFKVQRKGGKGIKTSDLILSTISTNTIDNLMLFTDKGKMYKILVNNIPEGTNSSKGENLSTLVNLDNDENVIAAASLDRSNENKYVVFITKKGQIKKTLLEEYKTAKKANGIIAIKLNEEDTIANVEFMNEEDIVLITKEGMSIYFNTRDIKAIGRATIGVKGIKLANEDEVVCGIPIKNKNECIGIFSENGYAKKVEIKKFTEQLRGGKGVIVYKYSSLTGKVADAALINEKDSLLLSGTPNSINISAEEVPLLDKTAIGNKMIKDTKIQKVIRI